MTEESGKANPKVRPGLEQPSNLNPNLKLRRRKRRPAEHYVAGIIRGDRVLLSQAITLVESQQTKHQELAQRIIEGCLPHSGHSVRIGITGSPGVGKSTFIEMLGERLIEKGQRVAVLAVDPSSQVSKGSILGDKTRMPQLARNEQAFIRPSPAGASLGGVARKSRETIILCEAAGFDTILVETVGVGQSETTVHSMVDFFLLLLLPGAGDELQGIKRGIVEMADLLAVNKADGERLTIAQQSRQEYRNALHLFPPKESQWTPRVITCSALTQLGIDEIWKAKAEYRALTQKSGYFEKHRREQARYWLYETIDQQLRTLFHDHPAVARERDSIEQQVQEGKISSFQGAEYLLRRFLEQ